MIIAVDLGRKATKQTLIYKKMDQHVVSILQSTCAWMFSIFYVSGLLAKHIMRKSRGSGGKATQWAVIDTPAKQHKKAFCWWADNCPLLVV